MLSAANVSNATRLDTEQTSDPAREGNRTTVERTKLSEDQNSMASATAAEKKATGQLAAGKRTKTRKNVQIGTNQRLKELQWQLIAMIVELNCC